MRKRAIPVAFLTFFLIAACQPVDREPVFDRSALPAPTSMPLPAKPPRVVATFSHRIVSFDVSPDASVIALATSRGVLLYDFKTGRHLRTVGGPENISSVAWSPDGGKLAVASFVDSGTRSPEGGNAGEAHLTVWDASSWKSIFEPDFGREMVNETFREIAWSPDSRSLAVSTDVDGVLVIGTQTGYVISHQTDFVSSVVGIAWSPDGSRLAATSDINSTVRRWRLSDNEFIRLFDPRLAFAMTVAWSPDGQRIASGHYQGGVCFWTAATNKCDGFIQAHRTATFSLAWSQDGNQLVTGGGVIRIWDTHSGKLVTAFGEQGGTIYNRIEWPAIDGPIVSLQTGLENPGDTAVRLWDAANGSILMEFDGKQEPG